MGHGKKQRRRLVINKQLQTQIIGAISWPAAICIMGSVALVGLFYGKVSQRALEVGIQLDGLFTMLMFAIAFILVSTVFFLFNSLKVSHRVAGPIYRINETLKQVRTGKTTLRAKIRQKDFLHDLASELNEFLDWAEDYLPSDAEDAAQSEPERETATSPR